MQVAQENEHWDFLAWYYFDPTGMIYINNYGEMGRGVMVNGLWNYQVMTLH
jgi:hypothetical protein